MEETQFSRISSISTLYIRSGFLLSNYQIIVLLTTLNEQVLFIEQVSSSNYLVESCELFLIQRNATALNELTHFAL